MRTEIKPCRWCGRNARFAVQMTIDGPADLITDQACLASDRILRGQPCEPMRIDLGLSARNANYSRKRRGKR